MEAIQHVPPELILQTLFTLISALLSAFLTYSLYLFKKRDAQREAENATARKKAAEAEARRDAEDRAERIGIQCLLRDRLLTACPAHEKEGWIDVHALENLNLMYEAYHGLGGNGTVTAVYTRVQKLPHAKPIAGES